jgi:hypothetical protein
MSKIATYRAMPEIKIEERKGEVCTVTSGELPTFPPWFIDGIQEMLMRLQSESAKISTKPAAQS